MAGYRGVKWRYSSLAVFQSFHGTISNLSASLEKGQSDVIFSYMEQYYRSLAQLETDITGVPFAKDMKCCSAYNQDIVIKIHKG